MQNFSVTFDQKNDLVEFKSDRHVLRLAPTPEPVRLTNAPPTQPPDRNLVPVG